MSRSKGAGVHIVELSYSHAREVESVSSLHEGESKINPNICVEVVAAKGRKTTDPIWKKPIFESQ